LFDFRLTLIRVNLFGKCANKVAVPKDALSLVWRSLFPTNGKLCEEARESELQKKAAKQSECQKGDSHKHNK